MMKKKAAIILSVLLIFALSTGCSKPPLERPKPTPSQTQEGGQEGNKKLNLKEELEGLLSGEADFQTQINEFLFRALENDGLDELKRAIDAFLEAETNKDPNKKDILTLLTDHYFASIFDQENSKESEVNPQD